MQPSKYIIPGRLKTIEGDASIPMCAGHRLIINVCSDDGTWDKNKTGIRWDKVKTEYLKWYRSQIKFVPGEIQEINVQSDTAVLNVLLNSDEQTLLKCIDKIGELAITYGSSVHINKRKDNWKTFEKALVEKIIKRGINVTIYS